jgi:hypothetical protein
LSSITSPVPAEDDTLATELPEPAATAEPAEPTEPAEPAEPAAAPTRRRAVARRALTGLAALLVYLALVTPHLYGQLNAAAFVRLPVEGLVGAALLVLLPQRPRRVVAVVLGALLGLLFILKVADLGFTWQQDRLFDVVLDWPRLGDAKGVVVASVGTAATYALVAVLVAVLAAFPYACALAMRRLTRLVARRDAAVLRALAALTVGWLTCAVLGVQLTAGVPLAARSDASLVQQHIVQLHQGLNDGQVYDREAREDVYANVPGDQLLTGLRGKDVILAFVESYGRSAVEDPRYAPRVGAVLDSGTAALKAAGFGARSGYLTSSTAGGGSWLAHASLMSGLFINNQQRYGTLVHSDRLTLPRAFNRAGWRTVSVEPAITGNWPERVFYGYDKGYDRPSIGYHGPQFSYAPIPDQYTFAQLQKLERGPGHPPLLAEVTMVSSHTPFSPIPRLLDWDELGDGSVYNRPQARQGGPGKALLGNNGKLRTAYRDSIEYSLSTLISYVRTYGDDNLVLVFLGDHQAAPAVVGAGASHDVPITVVAKDPRVLDRIAGWGWTDGLRPGPQAPVWRMDTFRDRFLTAFAR